MDYGHSLEAEPCSYIHKDQKSIDDECSIQYIYHYLWL